MKRLAAEEWRLLQALADGGTLKVHRTVEGDKRYRLHPLAGDEPEEISVTQVERLQRRGLIESNMKFPAAVFLLTEKGVALVGGPVVPVGPRRFVG